MMANWAQATADRVANAGPLSKGTLLLLGAADPGKTSLMYALAVRLAAQRSVALVGADVGQSHIGPPTPVGWTLLPPDDALYLVPDSDDPDRILEPPGIAFVGDVTPVGHLQLAATIVIRLDLPLGWS